MKGKRGAIRAAVCGGLLALSVSCAIQRENVTRSPRGARYPGYAIEYVDATPKPGSVLTEGTVIDLRVQVRYVLQSRDTGTIYFLFKDGDKDDVLPPGLVTPIRRGRWSEATLTQRIRVPRVFRDLIVAIPVLPDGDATSYGMLQIRYPVVPPR